MAGAVPSSVAAPRAERETVTRVRIARVSARFTATPVPRVTRAVSHAPAVVRLRIAERPRSIARAVSARSIARAFSAQAAPSRPISSKPVWDVASGNASAGGAASSGDAPAAGNGGSSQGNGASAADAAEPCGFVTFSDPHGSQYDPRTRGFWVDIRMSVHFADGSLQSMILDYPWYYASETDNPWSDRNLKDPSFPTRFQSPPAGKLGNEPPLVRYVMEHSTAGGMTLLKDCPSPPS